MIAALIAVAAAPTVAQSIDGRWINPDRTVIVTIAPCGSARCGTVSWASPEAIESAKAGTPNLVGTAVLTGLHPQKSDRWKGRLFIPDRNMRVSAKVDVAGAGSLKVSGCALGGLVCDTQNWTRAPAQNP